MSTNKMTNLNPIELTSAELDGIVGGSYNPSAFNSTNSSASQAAQAAQASSSKAMTDKMNAMLALTGKLSGR
jgi:hypothetical protein